MKKLNLIIGISTALLLISTAAFSGTYNMPRQKGRTSVISGVGNKFHPFAGIHGGYTIPQNIKGQALFSQDKSNFGGRFESGFQYMVDNYWSYIGSLGSGYYGTNTLKNTAVITSPIISPCKYSSARH